MSNNEFQLLSFKAYEALQIRLSGLGEQAAAPMYVVDTMGRVRWSNDAFGAMTGNLRKDIVGQLSLLFYRADFAPLFLRRRVAALLGQYVDPEISVVLHTQTGERHVSLHVSSLTDRRGEVLGRIALIRAKTGSAVTLRVGPSGFLGSPLARPATATFNHL